MVTDAVVEQNTVENADVGVEVESSVKGSLVRDNKFVNVDRQMIRTEKKE
jgi:nitrous oxidase accessory protein NosD